MRGNSNLIILIIIVLILLGLILLRKFDLLTFNIDANPSNEIQNETTIDTIGKELLYQNSINVKEGLESLKATKY